MLELSMLNICTAIDIFSFAYMNSFKRFNETKLAKKVVSITR